MRPNPSPSLDPLARWLAAEEASLGTADEAGVEEASDVAEAALAALFESLPETGPRLGFARRVSARIAAEKATVEAKRRFMAPRWLQVGLVAALFAAGLAALFLPGLVAVVLPAPSLAGGVRAATLVLGGVGEWIARAVESVKAWLELVRFLIEPLGRPETAATALLLLAMAGGSFVVLKMLIRRERSWTHA